MGRVGVELTMSLDGFIAGPNDGPAHPLGEGGDALFTWFEAGDTDFVVPSGTMTFKVSRASVALFNKTWPTYGAFVTGRRTFDIAQGWGGRHPLNVPIFVVSHQPRPEWAADLPNITFVSDGLPSAIAQAQAAAGAKNVSVNAASLAQQALKAGLLDDIQIDLVPLLLGSGVRFWGDSGAQPVPLEQLEPVVGTGVTHLRYRVVK
jgi:dihydrofolate reductase